MEADMPGRLQLLTGHCLAAVSLCVLICKVGEQLDPQQVCVRLDDVIRIKHLAEFLALNEALNKIS